MADLGIVEMKHECKCRTCGKLFIGDRPTRSYCSRSCNGRARSTIKPCVCKNCGVEFLPKEANRTTFCGRGCAYEWKSNNRKMPKEPVERECYFCGLPFTVGLWRYCSKVCAQLGKSRSIKAYYVKRNHKRWTKYPLKETTRICPNCAKQFIVKHRSGAGLKKFCSRRCRSAADQRRHRGIPKYALGYLIMRQRSKCAICKRKLKQPTIDHIEPISKGGTHDMNNLQAACMICNAIKSDNLNVQLRLAQ